MKTPVLKMANQLLMWINFSKHTVMFPIVCRQQSSLLGFGTEPIFFGRWAGQNGRSQTDSAVSVMGSGAGLVPSGSSRIREHQCQHVSQQSGLLTQQKSTHTHLRYTTHILYISTPRDKPKINLNKHGPKISTDSSA